MIPMNQLHAKQKGKHDLAHLDNGPPGQHSTRPSADNRKCSGMGNSVTGRIVRPAHKVVKGDVEVVCQGEKNESRRNSTAIFITLICLLGDFYPISDLLLRKLPFRSHFPELYG